MVLCEFFEHCLISTCWNSDGKSRLFKVTNLGDSGKQI